MAEDFGVGFDVVEVGDVFEIHLRANRSSNIGKRLFCITRHKDISHFSLLLKFLNKKSQWIIRLLQQQLPEKIVKRFLHLILFEIIGQLLLVSNFIFFVHLFEVC
jgi:hypothetical protein